MVLKHAAKRTLKLTHVGHGEYRPLDPSPSLDLQPPQAPVQERVPCWCSVKSQMREAPLKAQARPALTPRGRLLQTTPLTGETLPETRLRSVRPQQPWVCSIPSWGPEQPGETDFSCNRMSGSPSGLGLQDAVSALSLRRSAL